MRLGRSIVIAVAGLAALSAAGIGIADAQSGREVRRASPSRPPGKPMLAVIALNEQRITVYDALGPISQAPVSTGSAGYETPAGIFSIVQKNEFHRSNLYEDGDMPFMQRITWTGIALHAGALPGYPASHGCIRLPMNYAENLFGSTELGMRVVIVRDDMLPVEISHPTLFKSRPVPRALASTASPARRLAHKGGSAAERIAYAAADVDIVPGSPQHAALLGSVAAAKASEREAAVAREREAKQALARTQAEAAAAAKQLRAAESALGKAETALKEAERRLEKASSEGAQQAQAARAKALAALSEAQARLESVKLQAQAKSEAAEAARLEAHAATEARLDAAEAAAEAERNTAPVSVFISRKTQRIYIRKANYPIYEGPVTIRDADRPIGTFVFTALAPDGAAGNMRWNVVAMYPNPTNIEPPSPKSSQSRPRKADPTPTDVAAAEAALDRIEIPKAALERITEVVLPGSSLIISDEAASIETGKDTDFIVVMSDEPQGALKVRKPETRPQYDDEDYYWGRSPYGAYSPWFSSRPSRPRPSSRYPWW